MNEKPLGIKSYGSIPHLPNSRPGPGDHHITEGQARILTEKVRDRNDTVIVTEKLDGSCCAVARLENDKYGEPWIVALGRAGYRAETSPYKQHHLFYQWVGDQYWRFASILEPGERVVGEWLAMAHGTRYELKHEPFAIFDMFRANGERYPYAEMRQKIGQFITPRLISYGLPMTVREAMRRLDTGNPHGSIDPIEGAVWRVERKGKVDFLAKFVRHDKQDGTLMKQEMWNENLDSYIKPELDFWKQ